MFQHLGLLVVRIIILIFHLIRITLIKKKNNNNRFNYNINNIDITINNNIEKNLCRSNNNNNNNVAQFNINNNNNLVNSKTLFSNNNVCNNNVHSLSSFNSGVVNLSSFSFDPLIYSLLEKGLNFSLAPRKIQINEIICDIEYGIIDLPDVTKDIIGQGCAIILRKAKTPTYNINKLEFDALKSLNNNKDVLVLKVDKGGVVFFFVSLVGLHLHYVQYISRLGQGIELVTSHQGVP